MAVEMIPVEAGPIDVTVEDRLEIVDDAIRKKYLSRLSETPIAAPPELPGLEDDLIENVRMFRITEMVYQKGEPITGKLATVFNTLSTYCASVFVLIDSDGRSIELYLGVRNPYIAASPDKRSTVTLGDTLRKTLVGHFPGIRSENIDRNKIGAISKKIASLESVASVSVVGNSKSEGETANEQFVQGLEKLLLAMSGRSFVGLIIADSQPASSVQRMRKDWQDLYTKLSPYRSVQLSDSESSTSSRSKSFFEMDAKQKAAMIGGAAASLAGVGIGAAATATGGAAAMGVGSMLGGQVAGQLSGFISSLAPSEQVSTGTSRATTSTIENKAVADMMDHVDQLLKKTEEYDSYGLWNVAGYFCSDDMSSAEIAASNYRSLMNGENSGREVSAINSWHRAGTGAADGFSDLAFYLSRFIHPRFVYGGNALVDATTTVSGKELGLHLGLPRATVPGLPVVEHAEFGKEVTAHQLIPTGSTGGPEDRITIGKIYDLGRVTDKDVELDNKSLNMHTFVTGSTGSGKSNAVYQMLTELRQDGVPFLVVEPAKGEYKDAFGHLSDVSVFSTNPGVAQLVNLNPFMFPDAVHVLEHVDGLVEIFSVCWPMYDAMPAFFKNAILKSYESIGWDLGSSTFDGVEPEYPDFEVLAEQLDELIGASEYASDIKSNYRGALLTRVESLTVGLNKYIFTEGQTPYATLFDANCILDISRVKSAETKALIMGLTVYALNEYRMSQKTKNNQGLRHVTVLEEAHNLLKGQSSGSSELIGKSVEMLANTIAEIRTYGEGFIIVDQSPSSVDVAAIKNTNTKIVLRTPEAHDREAVGRSMGLTGDQVDEIAKLPSGVAVVYQNNWVSPVLTLINQAPIVERPYECSQAMPVKPLKQVRTELVSMLMQPWIEHERIRGKELKEDLKRIDATRKSKSAIRNLIDDYVFCGGRLVWATSEITKLQSLVRAVLAINDHELEVIVAEGSAERLREVVKSRTSGLSAQAVEEVCNIITLTGGEGNEA